jgi:hypothetical protein
MSSFISTTLVVPASATTGTPVVVNPRSPVALSLGGTFVGTVQFEYSPSASTALWISIGSALTAAGLVYLPAGKAKRIRANTTAYTSGTPVAALIHDLALEAADDERDVVESALAVAASVTTGTPLTLQDGEEATIRLYGTFVATVQFQISLTTSGTVWHDWAAPLTGAGEVIVPRGMAARIRANTTAFTSGTPAAIVLQGFTGELEPAEIIETVTTGALSLFARTSLISVTGTKAYTLANGFYAGQRKGVIVTVAASTPDGTLTPAAFADGTSLDLDAVLECCELIWTGANWRILSSSGLTVT